MPIIAVLIPTYEPSAAHLQAALDSLSAQTEQRWKAFIHDDASKTNVREMVEPYLKDARFHFERSPVRRGIGGNWNQTLNIASFGSRATDSRLATRNTQLETNSKYIQYLFQDDLWHPDYLQHSVELLEEDPKIGFVVSNHAYKTDEGSLPPIYEEIDEKRSAISSGRHDGNEFLLSWMRMGLRPNVIGEPSFVMIRHSLMRQAGPFHEKLVQGLDVEFWIRLLARSNFAFIPEKSGLFRVHAAGASARHDRSGSGLYDRLMCFETLLGALNDRRDRNVARRMIATEIADMIGKFKNRRMQGKAVGKLGSSAVAGFFARHPFLVTRALLQRMRWLPAE